MDIFSLKSSEMLSVYSFGGNERLQKLKMNVGKFWSIVTFSNG